MTGWNPTSAPLSHPGNVGGEVLPDEFGSEPLLGYRGWLVISVGDGVGYALRSLRLPYVWEPRVEAFCHKKGLMLPLGPHAGRISPDPTCSCGVYAQLPEHPLTEWDRAKRGKISASGTIAMWGRIIQCERGYKAQYAEIQAPLVLDLTCIPGCDEPPVRVGLPDLPRSPFSTYCAAHARLGHERVTIQAEIWLTEVKKRLSKKYNVEFLSWT